jgi:ubiquinone/menaquinone biosynthesis C-methylase UbiE
MIVNWPERLWVNSPVRRLVQAREAVFFKSLRELPAGACCLEIGCGRGAGVKLISRRFRPRRVDALDLDPRMIRLAKQASDKRGFAGGMLCVADAQAIPYRDESLEAVFNYGILHHLEDWKKGINEVSRILKREGTFYFEEIYPPLYANFLFRRLVDHPRANRFHGPEFRGALAEAGLYLLRGFVETRFFILGVAVKNTGRSLP